MYQQFSFLLPYGLRENESKRIIFFFFLSTFIRVRKKRRRKDHTGVLKDQIGNLTTFGKEVNI